MKIRITVVDFKVYTFMEVATVITFMIKGTEFVLRWQHFLWQMVAIRTVKVKKTF
jgi:hypothetical protein